MKIFRFAIVEHAPRLIAKEDVQLVNLVEILLLIVRTKGIESHQVEVPELAFPSLFGAWKK